jgi:hypothetical protein
MIDLTISQLNRPQDCEHHVFSKLKRREPAMFLGLVSRAISLINTATPSTSINIHLSP